MIKTRCAILILCMLFILTAAPAYAQVTEVYAGVEAGDLFAGLRYALTQSLEGLLEYSEGKGISGVGIFYKSTPWDIELIRRTDSWEVGIASQPVGSLYVDSDESKGELDGIFSLRLGQLYSTGKLSQEPGESKGSLNTYYTWLGGKSSILWRFKEEGERLQNLTLSHDFKVGKHQIVASWQSNEYDVSGHDLVGQGIEVLWQPSSWLRLGMGSFDEKPTGVAAQRYRVKLGHEFTYKMNSTLFGLEGAVEDFLYSQGDNRLELTIGGRARHPWNGGYAELKLTRIQRSGETPFHFDDDPELDFLVVPEIQQKIGSTISKISATYDALNNKWKYAKGSLQAPLTDKLSCSFTADYDLDDPPEPDDTTYTMTVTQRGDINLQGRATFNSEFNTLLVGGRAEFPLREHRLGFGANYDVHEQGLDDVFISLKLKKAGKITLTYEPATPKIMASYQPLRW
ncbi:MAG TPA: hypothetical protein GX506_03310 [Firmicutes bacterium]|nr:hypothetical protein [Bacillota bacterium]